jgi:tyrosyl-tRNA synthetase
LQSDVELGGTDQKFNLLVGRELQKAYGQKEQQNIITSPILEGLEGVQKMSKSLNNYIAVIDSANEMFGKIMSISDALMYRYYLLLTDLTETQITALKNKVSSKDLHPRQVKVDLAKAIITRFHSSQAALDAEAEFNKVFREKGQPSDIGTYVWNSETESIALSHLMTLAGLAPSNSESRRLIAGRAVEINEVKIEDEKHTVTLKPGEEILLKAGKKKFMKVKRS